MRRTTAVIAGIAIAAGTTLTVAAPAQAAPTCQTHVRNTTVNGRAVTQLYITGSPYSTRRVHAFQLRWGWGPTTSTYTPTYRTYNAPRHTPLWHARGWVNGYTCQDWDHNTSPIGN